MKNFNFGEAIEALKQGKKVARKGWNGKGMYVLLQTPDENSKMNRPYIYSIIPRKFPQRYPFQGKILRVSNRVSNLNYSADGLKKIFPKYFPGNIAESYARNPEKIASKVYGGRMGNGGEETKEGYKFRGRGYIQLTGKENYTSFAKSIGEDTVANPDLVATKYALASAGWFFSKNGLNAIADKGADDATVTAVTKRVNGGTIGLPDRIKHFKEYYHLLA